MGNNVSVVHLPNYAGKSCDTALVDELTLAGIEVTDIGIKIPGEVPTSICGTIRHWSFKRYWTYWVCNGPGIPIVEAMKLHEAHGEYVRVDGDCTGPSPLEQFGGFGTGHYHVDTLVGLKALADTIKQVYEDGV